MISEMTLIYLFSSLQGIYVFTMLNLQSVSSLFWELSEFWTKILSLAFYISDREKNKPENGHLYGTGKMSQRLLKLILELRYVLHSYGKI